MGIKMKLEEVMDMWKLNTHIQVTKYVKNGITREKTF